MTELIPQAYKQSGKTFSKIILLRKLSSLIIKIFFPIKKMFFRNIFLQQFQSFIELKVNNIKLKFRESKLLLDNHR